MAVEKPVEVEAVVDFDLGDYVDKDAAKAVKPKIHIGGDTCVSCEG